MRPYATVGGVTVYHADALDLLRSLPDASVQLVATDPPYFGVVDEAWDNVWQSEREFLRWVGHLCVEWWRVLAPAGSLYVFASPHMAHGVERVIRRHFRVLNSLAWRKEQARHKAADQDALRGYFPQTERIIFAEHKDADEVADAVAGYSETCNAERRGAFGEYLRLEFERAGVGIKQVCGAIGAFGRVNNGGAVTNWTLGYNTPSAEQYEAMRRYLNGLGRGEFLARPHAELLAQYEARQGEIRAAWERLEGVRRPFAPVGAAFTDVWDFPTVSSYPGKHPCEKPLAMMEHIVRTSSRPGDVVLDTFCGSGATAEAARNLGRKAIVGDADAHWCGWTARRLSQETLFAALDGAA